MFVVLPTPSSGDCEVAAERSLPATVAGQFDAEIAAPVFTRRTPTGTRAFTLNQECGWKQGESAVGEQNKRKKNFTPPSRSPRGRLGGWVPPTPQRRRLPPQEGQAPLRDPPKKRRASERFLLTEAGLLMEAATVRSGTLRSICTVFSTER